MSHTDHESMENSGRHIRDEGGRLGSAVAQHRKDLNSLVAYFGNPATDEAAQIFRKGQDGHPGFDSADDDLERAVKNVEAAYEAIGRALLAMSENIKIADWASMVDNTPVKAVIEFAERKNDKVGVPTTLAESR
ncbi:hypothetical protein [Nonomuraea sp. NPDC048916]|uniref:hypothetical protein n=1 Tax=Nonomuraea sp. NPDC048916 TaxID=3154232 RepID=UPI0033D7961C